MDNNLTPKVYFLITFLVYLATFALEIKKGT